jgi:hypothetical protein
MGRFSSDSGITKYPVMTPSLPALSLFVLDSSM